MTDKVVVTNLSALKAKYQPAEVRRILEAVDALREADRGRGLRTRLVELDNRDRMRGLRARAVVDPASERENKEAIDGVCRRLTPDYLMILGSVDVVPHQSLTNPLFDGDDDPDGDRFAFSDLPYACEAPYSRNPADFAGPTRVVGRLPDLTGARSPELLLSLLATATGWASRTRATYESWFAVSAHVWRKSTEKTLTKLFGDGADLRVSPPRGPRWGRRLLERPTHFVNCHGDTETPNFRGQRGERYPIALTSDYLAKKIRPGTIAAFECCYGAELYDPALVHLPRGICYAYLAQRAYGVFGSSTIAWGGDDSTVNADLLCRYFVKRVLEGSSLGRATLEARLTYAQIMGELDPTDLKTLAQFNLMGDPSIHPVLPEPERARKRRSRKSRRRRRARPALPAGRKLRRLELAERGFSVSATARVARRSRTLRPGRQVRAELRRAARGERLGRIKVLSYEIHGGSTPRGVAERVGGRGAFHVVASTRPARGEQKLSRTALVVREHDGQVTMVRRIHRR